MIIVRCIIIVNAMMGISKKLQLLQRADGAENRCDALAEWVLEHDA